MDYQWCHGPRCHKRATTTRVRGVKGSKVLRTMKINVSGQYPQGVYKYFCDQTCLHDFIWKYFQEFVALHPRTECLETPIEVTTETRTDWRGQPYQTKVINKIDNNSNP